MAAIALIVIAMRYSMSVAFRSQPTRDEARRIAADVAKLLAPINQASRARTRRLVVPQTGMACQSA